MKKKTRYTEKRKRFSQLNKANDRHILWQRRHDLYRTGPKNRKSLGRFSIPLDKKDMRIPTNSHAFL